MYGGGGGRGAGASKLAGRFSFCQPHRSSSALPPNLRGAPNSTSSAVAAVHEKFSLVAGINQVAAFGMIIRLAPDLVEQIRRVEADGGTPRIKFDSHSNSHDGKNVGFEVGGKEFRFTWSRDGDLCDIYEECETGEGGNGLLVESGCAWCKVNVQRELDESTRNNVKRMTEEAKPMHKPRKTIVLEQNSVTKNQLAQYDSTENSSWKNFKQKKEPPFKKPKFGPPQVSAPPKSVYKSGVASVTTAKGTPLSSHLPATPKKSVSPFGMLNISKTNASADEIIPSKVIINDKPIPSLDKEAIRNTAAIKTEARVATSTSRDNGSESVSSDSGSPRIHRSRSKSPGSSSDSDSDVSFNSREVSDEDVDIMSDDDKAPKHQTLPRGTPDGRPAQSGNDDKQDDFESDKIDIETVDHDAELAVVSISLPSEQPFIETKSSPPELVKRHDSRNLVDNLFGKTTEDPDHANTSSYIFTKYFFDFIQNLQILR